jgi:hypothetical protein
MPNGFSEIRLSWDPKANPRIKAVAEDEQNHKSNSGDLSTGPGKNIRWVHDGGTDYTFSVTFVNKNDPTETWPFAPTSDGSHVLSVEAGKKPMRQLRYFQNRDWEYTVTLPNGDVLDPMIIIRSGRFSKAAIALAALGGIVAGALVASLYFLEWS